ncbi:hypothetical protein ACFPFV_03780 [Salinicoccus siamensis]|uniref:hypothetical protein n=1 Tax=Salinicoccus siamensis TaxID=381830 RepID=UPI0036134F33
MLLLYCFASLPSNLYFSKGASLFLHFHTSSRLLDDQIDFQDIRTLHSLQIDRISLLYVNGHKSP